MAGRIIKTTKIKTRIKVRHKEVPEVAEGNLKTSKVKPDALGDLVMLTYPRPVPVTSIGSMESLLGFVEIVTGVLGGTTSRHALDITEILMPALLKKQNEGPTSLTDK